MSASHSTHLLPYLVYSDSYLGMVLSTDSTHIAIGRALLNHLCGAVALMMSALDAETLPSWLVLPAW